MNSKAFSIIIPTAGRVDDLRACLLSIFEHLGQNQDFLVCVVDNNSDFLISSLVRDICHVHSHSCLYLKEDKPGLTAARHKALEITDTPVLCFVDDDVRFTSTWFDSTRKSFSDPETALAGGPTIPYFSSSIPPWFWDFLSDSPYGGWSCGWLSLLDIGCDIDIIDPNWIWGLNFAIRREALLDCGGFHTDLVPSQYMRWQGDGETGLTMKLASKGYKAVYRQDSLLFHHCGADRLRPEYFAKRAYYQGVCNSYSELRRKMRNFDDHFRYDESIYNTSPHVKQTLRALRSSLSRIRSLLPTQPDTQTTESPWRSAAAGVRALCQQAERDGFLFHQQEAAADQALREWISRDNYFNVDLRELSH